MLEGDCRAQLATLDEGTVQTCVTSPPYFGLRDYGHDGQIGLEPTPEDFVAAMVDVFRSVRRVLRDDGTVWLNLGDSFNAYNGGAGPGSKLSKTQTEQRPKLSTGYGLQVKSLKPKDLIGIPWMVAFALRADGWFLRSDIIWSKPNPMPESVQDRPTKAHEYLFLLSKSPRYFYDADAIREDLADANAQRTTAHYDTAERYGAGNGGNGGLDSLAARMRDGNHAGRNRRTVWEIATQPFPGAHFATFPPKLIEPCILAGSSPQACGKCGAPWERVVERTPMVVRPTEKRAEWQATDDHARTQVGGTMLEPATARTTGWKPSCGHDDGTGHCTVLDPFSGSGTTGMVALRHGRGYVGCELNPEYVELSRRRIVDDAPLLNTFAEAA